ncbi:hypothetical protein Fmac_019109 [Flemingia macrophylla]|uniref:Uncharacterized protein n=1 Tax=Flemingia macrophylla TaxID=520843 RepID=A0ABD1M6V4_9FABA
MEEMLRDHSASLGGGSLSMHIFLSGIAYIFQTWRYLYIASSIPSFLYIILVPKMGRCFPDGVILALDQDLSSNGEGLETKFKRYELEKQPILNVMINAVGEMPAFFYNGGAIGEVKEFSDGGEERGVRVCHSDGGHGRDVGSICGGFGRVVSA